MSDNAKPAANRRNFLKLAGATVATGSAATGAVATTVPRVEAQADDALYRETEHVRRYYESAR